MLLGILKTDNHAYEKGYDDGYNQYPIDKHYADNKDYMQGYLDGREDDDMDLEEDEY